MNQEATTQNQQIVAIMTQDELVQELKTILARQTGAMNLFREGRWYHAHNRFQSVKDKLEALILLIIPSNTIIAEDDIPADEAQI